MDVESRQDLGKACIVKRHKTSFIQRIILKHFLNFVNKKLLFLNILNQLDDYF